MEDIIADPKTFINEIGVGAGNKYKLELKKGVSHKNKVKDFFFGECKPEVLNSLTSVMKFKINGTDYSLFDIENNFHRQVSL